MTGRTEMRAKDGAERTRADNRDVHMKTCASSGSIGSDGVESIRIRAGRVASPNGRKRLF